MNLNVKTEQLLRMKIENAQKRISSYKRKLKRIEKSKFKSELTKLKPLLNKYSAEDILDRFED